MAQRPTEELGPAKRPTVQLADSSQRATEELPAPPVFIPPPLAVYSPPPKPQAGAYSITPKKVRASSEADGSTPRKARASSEPGSAGLAPACEVVEILDGGIKLRVRDQVCKLGWSEVHALAAELVRVLKST